MMNINFTKKIMKYSDQILELVDNQEEFTRSDLQGCVEAIVMNILRERGDDEDEN